jgi:hypothetical protein
VDHGGKSHRGVPHDSQWGREDRPPLPRETRREGFSNFNHDHAAAGEPSDQSSNSDHSNAVGDTAVG